MSAEAYREEEMYREAEPSLISIKRNPYLVDYEQQRKLREHGEQRMIRRDQGYPRRTSQRGQVSQGEQGLRRTSRRMPPQEQEMRRISQGVSRPETRTISQRTFQGEQEMGRMSRSASQRIPQREPETRRASQRMPRQGQELRRTPQRMPQRGQEIQQIQEGNRRAAMEKRRAALRRRRIVRMQRMVLFTGIFFITLLCGMLYLKRINVKAEEPDNKDWQTTMTDHALPADASSGMVQGLPAAEYAKHPEWEEKFLTPNEYSRPGDALEEVNSIFVHYTANPNTSAAQNRSYFEQLKDTHITSASAHFIIGYDGEIIQCIPLDEIAYAVQTRNYDSISIECCYKSTDGSFTQETYDSLIKLLAWLTDAYDLTTDDILRHYDCGGKKCPIYYTEHEDAWVKLKSDVEEIL